MLKETMREYLQFFKEKGQVSVLPISESDIKDLRNYFENKGYPTQLVKGYLVKDKERLVEIKNWRDYIDNESINIKDLENYLEYDGWLEEGSLWLYHYYSEGNDLFWNKYDFVFDEKILENCKK